MSEAEFTVQRHRLNRTQMRALKRRPHFREESIELAISNGASYYRDYWEDALEDDATSDAIDRFEVIEYWGILDTELAEEADIDLPPEFEDRDEVQVNAWVCNGQILRLVINPFTPTRIPYSAVPYELNPYSLFGTKVTLGVIPLGKILNLIKIIDEISIRIKVTIPNIVISKKNFFTNLN